MSMPLPSRHLSSLTLRNGFSALQSSSWVELALFLACALGPAPFVPYILGSKEKKKKKKGGVATKGSVETVPQQAGAEQAVASEWLART